MGDMRRKFGNHAPWDIEDLLTSSYLKAIVGAELFCIDEAALGRILTLFAFS